MKAQVKLTAARVTYEHVPHDRHQVVDGIPVLLGVEVLRVLNTAALELGIGDQALDSLVGHPWVGG